MEVAEESFGAFFEAMLPVLDERRSEIDGSLRAGTYILEFNPYSRGGRAQFELTAEVTR